MRHNMTLSKNVGKVGDVITVVGPVNRKGKKGDRMVYEPRVNGKPAGKDAWFSDDRGYQDGSRINASGAKVGDVVAVTGTIYEYAGGKLGVENVTSIVVVDHVTRDDIVAMSANVPASCADDTCALCGKHVTVPKYVITPSGDVRTYDTVKCQKRAVASLY